jgi:hypothetical protein
MMSLSKCRRCSECRGEEHHWMTAIPDVWEDDGTMIIPCKHCEAVATALMCDNCGDVEPLPPDTEEPDDYLCPECIQDALGLEADKSQLKLLE